MQIPTTDELLKRLNSIDSESALDNFTGNVAKMNPVISFPEYISNHLQQKNMTPAELIRNAQIQRNYGYQILNGTKHPGRDKIIALCLALALSLDEVQRALTIEKEGVLYPKNRRDSVLIFCINKHMCVLDTNELLYKTGEKTL